MKNWQVWSDVLLGDGSVPLSFTCDDSTKIRVDSEPQVFAEVDCIEWTPRLCNVAEGDSPRLSKLCSLDLVLAPLVDMGLPTMHTIRGCENGAVPFALEHIVLGRGKTCRINNPSGGKTGMHLPFINLDLGGHGLFCALGWPGRWTLSLEHREDGSLRLTGGIEKANLVLQSKEEITLPTVLLMFWKGDRLAAQNRFRQHILKHHSPSCNGEPAPHLLACLSWGGMKTKNHLRLIEALKQQETGFDCYWMDAGWYGAEHETAEYQDLQTEDWFFHVGDWRPNRAVHPNGLKPVSDAARAAGMKFLLWFEVERAIETSPWVRKHPEWYFKRRITSTLAGRSCNWRIFNFGNPDSLHAMTVNIASLIEQNGIDVFRQDCNVDLAGCWDEEDAPDRVGISEIRYVEGLLAFWGKLKELFPYLLFDIVQRRDLTTIAWSIDMTRTDHEFLPHTDVSSSQIALYGLSHWTPLSGTIVPYRPGDDYVALSGLSPSFGVMILPVISDVPIDVNILADYPWEWLRRILDIHRRARPFFHGDFYPLLGNIQSNEYWTAMQFYRPDLSAGMVLVYRRPNSSFLSACFTLHGFEPGQNCQIDYSTGSEIQLDEQTLAVTLTNIPDAALVFYSVRQT